MNLDIIWITLLFCILGYFIGSLNFSLILSKYNQSIDIKNVGSKNAGATNALRSYGWKIALIIFMVDVSKAYWFAFALGAIETFALEDKIIPQIATIFVIVGHIWPMFFQFKGGKGAACILGMISSISLIMAATGTVLFFVIVGITKYVSLGSMGVPPILAFFSFVPFYGNFYDSMINISNHELINFVTIFLASLLVIFSHRNNIRKLINGQENKLKSS